MKWFGNRDDRRIGELLGSPWTAWALEQWAKTQLLRAPDPGVDPTEAIYAVGPVRTLVQDTRSGEVDAEKAFNCLATLVQRNSGWVPVGVWRLLHEYGPPQWLGDERIRAWFVDGLRAIAPANDGRQFPYQPYEDEEELLRNVAGPHDPLWLFIPLRGKDLVPLAVPNHGTEPPYTALAVGEERLVVVNTPHPGSSMLFATQRAPSVFVGMVDSPRNNEDPTRVRIDLTFGDSLPNLFRRIGENLSTRTSVHWAHPELEPYFPYGYPAWRQP
jgi:hypothetical protein